MIIAGTISAYLTLSIDEFRTNAAAAMLLMDQMSAMGQGCAHGIDSIETSARKAGASLSGTLPAAAAALTGCLTGLGAGAGSVTAALGILGAAAVSSAASLSASGAGAQDSVQRSTSAMSAAFFSATASASSSGAGISAAMAGAASGAAVSLTSVSTSVSRLSASQTQALTISQGISRNILTPSKDLKEPLAQAMVHAGQGMADGLSSKRSAIVGVARGIASAVRSTIESALEIASPSKVMRRIGAFTAEGMALGMEDGLPRIASGASAMARTVEQLSAASVSAPEVSAFVTGAERRPAAPDTEERNAAADLSVLTDRLERLVDYLYDTEPVLRVDGRAFGRMVREYV